MLFMKLEKELKRLAIRGFGWLVVKRILTQILLTGANLVLVRFLFPEEFGVFRIVQTIVTLSWVFADVGLSKALVQREREPSRDLLRSVWWTQLALGVLMVGFLWLVGPLFIGYYSGQLNSSAVVWLRWLAISQLFTNVSLVSSSLLERKLAYGRVMVGEIAELFVTQSVTILLAVLNFGVVSFVIGTFFGKLVGMVLFFLLSRWSWGFGWKLSDLRSLLSFGFPLQAASWVGILNGAVVPVFVGRFPGPGGWSGPEAVGFITWASGVSVLPVALAGVFEQLLFPLLSRIRGSRAFASRIFERALRMVIVVALPSGVMLFILAGEVTEIVYTPLWLPALPALRFSIIHSFLAAVSGLALTALLAFGGSKFFRKMHILWALLQWILTVPLVLIFGFWGVTLASVFVSATGLYSFNKLREYLDIRFFKIVTYPVLGSLLLGVVLYFWSHYFKVENFIELGVLALGGMALYMIWISVFMRRMIVKEVRLVGGLLKGLV